MRVSARVKALACGVLLAFAGFANALSESSSAGKHAAATYEELRKRNFLKELSKINFYAVKQDIVALMHSSQDFFPSDYHHYGPFFIRLAWHCAGTYRKFDGEGGCDGGRQRFEPELHWPDNGNLDKAHRLLQPIKDKYGYGLSWGDLFVLAGTTAIEDMGGPVLGFCAGRFDDISGQDSIPLGPSELQEKFDNCRERGENGDCKAPLGQQQIGLIYVNPEGFKGIPDPKISLEPTRDVFGRMGMNDSETAALIAGGHSFGKTHADVDGTHGGYGVVTSGFEGPFTGTPTQWNLDFLKLLLGYTWEKLLGPAGHFQWKILEKIDQTIDVAEEAPTADLSGVQDVRMLTTDVAMLEDPSYKAILKAWEFNLPAFDRAFSHAWYKLMTRDMGPVSRCVGPMTAPAQPFQAPLPAPYQINPRWSKVERDLMDVIEAGDAALFVELAYLCASTHRFTDYAGGCNGARIRLSPEKDWDDRQGVQSALEKLAPIKEKYTKNENNGVSFADLIVLAGTIALQPENVYGWYPHVESYDFCPGRSDADSAPASDNLKVYQFDDKSFQFQREARLFGITPSELVVLRGRPRSDAYMQAQGYSGSYSTSSKLTNEYFKLLLSEQWMKVEPAVTGTFGAEYTNTQGTKFMTEADILLINDPELRAAVVEYAERPELFRAVFKNTWTNLMNADRYDGPIENVCTNGKVDIYSTMSSRWGWF